MKVVIRLALLAVGLALAMAAYLALTGTASRGILLTGAKAAAIEGETGVVGVFLKIENPGGPDRLTGAHSPVAQAALLSAGAPPDGLPIPAGSSPVLAPDGAFIRLEGVTGGLEDGRVIPVTLEFASAGALTTRARLAAPKHEGEAHEFGLFGIGDICRVGEGEPAPRIDLEVRPDGTGWLVEVDTEDFTFSRELADGPHIPGTGHGHLYLGGLKLQRLYEPSARIGALPAGQHRVTVTLNTNDHRAYVVGETPVTAEAMISQW